MTSHEERVRARAEQLWKQAGTPEGRDEEFWHKAEAEITAEDAANSRPRPPASPPGRS